MKICKRKLCTTALAVIMIAMYGCGDKPPVKSAKKSAPQKSARHDPSLTGQVADVAPQEADEHEGYIYQQRDRRDPFVPLIEPARAIEGKVEREIGTLESYDLSEFKLSAVAKKGNEYFALLFTPDNRSFTVSKGSVIGLSKGKVNQILNDRVILVEYSKDFRGELKERKIILEFHKGEKK